MTSGTLAIAAIAKLFVDSQRLIARSQNRTKCVAQQVGMVHFYAVAEIKRLSCRLR